MYSNGMINKAKEDSVIKSKLMDLPINSDRFLKYRIFDIQRIN